MSKSKRPSSEFTRVVRDAPQSAIEPIRRAAAARGHEGATLGAGGGAMVGAMLGSFFGPVGAIVGGALGGGAGFVAGSDLDEP